MEFLKTYHESIMDSIDTIDEAQNYSEYTVALAICEQCVKCMDIDENYYGNNINGFAIYQEADAGNQNISNNNVQQTREPLIVKALLAIPRLLMSIIKMITGKFKAKKTVPGNKAYMKYGVARPLSDKEVAEIKEKKKTSPMYKAIVGVGCVGITAVGAGLAFRISDFSEAVEFKDDVSFTIAEDLSSIRVVFPFYKIDAVKQFNDKCDAAISEMESKNAYSGIVNLLKIVNTNQARVSERDFKKPADWVSFYDNEINNAFAVFGDKLKTLKDAVEKQASGNITPEIKDLIKAIQELGAKIPGDIELITKFNDKMNQVYGILANPDDYSSRKVKKAQAFTFKPVFDKDKINIYKIDNTHLMNAVNYFNKFAESVKALDKETILKRAENNPDFVRGTHELMEQFNCTINFKIYDCGGATATHHNSKGIQNITFSKTKGFDLGGAELEIYIDPAYAIEQAGGDGVAGQMLCGIQCHEIFHNIALLIHLYGSKIYDAFRKAMLNTYEVYETVKAFIMHFLGEYSKGLGVSLINDDKTIKRFAYLIQNYDDEAKIKSFTQQVASNSDEQLLSSVDINSGDFGDKAQTFVSKLLYFLNSEGGLIISAIMTIVYRYNFLIGGMFAISTLFIGMYGFTQVKMSKTNEESMCDMCAAIYKLPVYLTDVSSIRRNKGERKSKTHGVYDVHSATFDRQTVSLGLAKEMLNSGEKLDPEVEKYLEFIVDKNEGNQYAERKFTKGQMKQSAPAFTENINRAITNFVKDHNIPLTD